jgi:probable addiction module antidote protein
MSTSKARTKLLPFDAARYLTDDAAVAEYMTVVLETDDPDLLLLALGDVARARGMAQVAKDAGLGRESLYKALAPGAKPRFDTVLKVARALGVRLSAHPAQQRVQRSRYPPVQGGPRLLKTGRRNA